MKLRCHTCGKVEYHDPKPAFMAGWDFPPACPVTTCPTCSSAEVLLPPKPKSKCCKADVKVEGKTTLYYICTACGQPCDA